MQTLVEESNNPYGVHPDSWRWNPVVDGQDFQRFLEASALPVEAQDYLRMFTPRLLGQSAPPALEGRSTGLVIGKVQSGKTNSFLGLAALASDNGYRIIILLSGTKNILKGQTHRQVIEKLTRGARGWMAIDFDPAIDRSDFETTLLAALSTIARRTLVITILKRTRTSATAPSSGIDRLAELLESSDLRTRLETEPVLIIDDEADEASLDNSANARHQRRPNKPTPTFDAIRRLRDLFRCQFFVQYTATPQANLLVELSDQLSPDFCELLQPGAGYTGAIDFFPTRPVHWVEIPEADLAHMANLSPIPPDSLVDALRAFYVASALEEYLVSGTPVSRSMLVHPERSVEAHVLAHHWVQQVRSRLLESVEEAILRPDGAIARELYDEFEAALLELSSTVVVPRIDVRDLMSLIHGRIQDTQVRLINSQRQLTEPIDWDDTLCWIFVGGDVLQRGFAFQGLTVTWMARSAGTGQVDVLLQRGRFFGYRRDYLQYCRVWLPRALHDEYYALFADHEESLWRSLGEHLARGRRLNDWSRVFWLNPNPALRLCRRSSQWFRLRPQAEWASQRWLPEADSTEDVESAARNGRLLDDFCNSRSDWAQQWRPNPANEAREHLYVEIPLVDVANLFDRYAFFGPDVVELAVIRDAIATMVETQPERAAVLIQMRPRYSDYRGVLTDVPAVRRLQGGRSREGQPYYPGDHEFRAGGRGLPTLDPSRLTVQIHRPALRRGSESLTAPGGYLSDGCPLLAVWIPEDVRHYRREDYNASRG